MPIAELNDLELKIDHLINVIKNLKLENTSLQTKLVQCAQERSRIQEQNHKASLQIKKIISQLKEELS